MIKPNKNEMIIGQTTLDLKELVKWAEEISGRWNGDNEGIIAERAHIADDIAEKSNELITLLNEMDESINQTYTD